MPLPSLSSLWRGNPAATDEPGACRVLRTITVLGGWSQHDVRTYAAGADGVAQDADGPNRAILRGISILNNATTVGNDLQVSLFVDSGTNTPDPANAYNTALANGPSLDLRFPSGLGQRYFWVNAPSGTPDVQLEIWYDVPPAS